MLEIAMSVLAAWGTYEFIYDVLPRIPLWATFPLLIGLSCAAYFAPWAVLCIVAVASAAGFIHGMIRRNTATQVEVPSRRSSRNLPPLP